MTELRLVRGDTNFFIEFTVKDSEGNLVSLENAVVRFKSQIYNSSSLQWNILGEVTDASSGVCRFYITNELENLVAELQGEIEITYSGGRVITAPDISIRVIADLPK